MQEENDISKLLRLKRYEQPPPEYFETFLQDFKDRQRAQLLREPAWRIAWDRLRAYVGEQATVRIGYGMASAAVLVAAGIASLDIVESRPAVMALIPGTTRHMMAQVASLKLGPNQLPALPSLASRSAPSTSAPRYVMDTRPVSYEPSSSF